MLLVGIVEETQAGGEVGQNTGGLMDARRNGRGGTRFIVIL